MKKTILYLLLVLLFITPSTIKAADCWNSEMDVHIRDGSVVTLDAVPADISITLSPAKAIKSFTMTVDVRNDWANVRNLTVKVYANNQEYAISNNYYTTTKLSNENIEISFDDDKLKEFISDNNIDGTIKFFADFIITGKHAGTLTLSASSIINNNECPIITKKVTTITKPILDKALCGQKPKPVLPVVEGIKYDIQEIKNAYLITATPLNGYEIAENTTREWKLDYKISKCPSSVNKVNKTNKKTNNSSNNKILKVPNTGDNTLNNVLAIIALASLIIGTSFAIRKD